MNLRSLKKKAKRAPTPTKSDTAGTSSVISSRLRINELFAQANALYQSQHFEHCSQLLHLILDQQADNLPALQLLGNLQLQTNRFLEALHTFEQGQHRGSLYCP